MRQRPTPCLALLLSLLLMDALIPASAQDQRPYKAIAYFTWWSIIDRDYYVTDIPADLLTHVNYAFANVSGTGECVVGNEQADTRFLYPGDQSDQALAGNFNQFRLLKERFPYLKTLISVGGWSWSGKFSDAALTAESRQRFAASCVALMKHYGFDGLDIDWEYPTGGGLDPAAGRPEDTRNFTLLLAELRAQLDAQGEHDGGAHYLLTIAAPAGPRLYRALQLDQIYPYLDWLNVMTYDFHGGWNPTTNFNSPLFATTDDPDSENASLNADVAMQAYLAAGIPPEKLVLGVPFYGRGWSGVPDHHHGLYQPASSLPDGTWEPGAFDYSDLAANYVGRYTRFWHDEAQVPWLYSAEDRIMISYDDPQSMALKAGYIKENRLGGVMFWELSQDSDDHALLKALTGTLNAP